MESGSIQEVTARLESWCARPGHGLARVEWDSVFARKEVVAKLKDALTPLGISLSEIALPPGEAPHQTVATLMDKLRVHTGSVVSITDIEWAFPEGGSRLDTLAALSFQREILASIPVRQIWWIPSHLTEQFILGVPDLDSWFQLRLHLTETPPSIFWPRLEQAGRGASSVAEARALARRFWGRLEASRAQNVSEARIWTELAQPTVEALRSAGLEDEALQILARVSDARGQLERRLEEFRQSHGLDHPVVLSLVENLSRLLKEQGDFAGARALQEQVLESRTRLLGPENPSTLNTMNNLAGMLFSEGDLAGAQQLLERVLEFRTRALGPSHPSTLATANNLAVTLSAQGNYPPARSLLERVLQATKNGEGEENLNTLSAMHNLASTLTAQGDYGAARRLQEQVLAARTRLLGDANPITLTTMNNLASTLWFQGEHEEAMRLLRRCLDLRRNILGEEHPDTLLTSAAVRSMEAQLAASSG